MSGRNHLTNRRKAGHTSSREPRDFAAPATRARGAKLGGETFGSLEMALGQRYLVPQSHIDMVI